PMTGAKSRIGRRAHRLLRQTRRQENVIVCSDRGLRDLPDTNLACAKLYAWQQAAIATDAVTWIIINARKEHISGVIVDVAVALVKVEPGRHRPGRSQRQPDFDGYYGWQLKILVPLRRG